MICSISQKFAEQPVVSKKSGLIFERRLIEKHLKTSDFCPVTKEPLGFTDLVAVKTAPEAAAGSGGGGGGSIGVKGNSIPEVLSLLQNEWDALMLESFALKQQLQNARQELCHSLYQHDAACRVISRLTKERDDARHELEAVSAKIAGLNQVNIEENNNGKKKQKLNVEHASPVEKMCEEIRLKSVELSVARKGRKASESLANEDEIKKYEAHSFSLNVGNKEKSKASEITSVDIDKNLLLAAGTDGTVALFDLAAKKSLALFDAHQKKKVTDVSFVPSSSSSSHAVSFVTASADKTVKYWQNDNNNENNNNTKYTVKSSFTSHNSTVTGVSVNPVSHYIFSCSTDSSWAIHDIESGSTILKKSESELEGVGLNRIRCHPDGVLLACAAADGGAYLFESNGQSLVKALKGHEGAVSSVSFSENGFHLASSGLTDNSVKIWDLRKLEVLQTIDLPNNSGLKSVDFDYSGKYLLVSGKDSHVYTRKHWAHVGSYKTSSIAGDDEGFVNASKFGTDAKYFVTAGSKGVCATWQ